MLHHKNWDNFDVVRYTRIKQIKPSTQKDAQIKISYIKSNTIDCFFILIKDLL